MPKSNNLRQYTADLLRSIELTCFLACTGSKLANHIFVSIAQNVNLLRSFYTELYVIKCKQNIAYKRIFIIGCLSKLRGSKVNIRKQTTEILLAVTSERTILNTFQ